MKLKIKSKFWIEDEKGKPVFGGGRRAILEEIDKRGSISAAAEALHMSYRAVWGRIKATEKRLGLKLVAASPGGGPKSGARLTPEARTLLERFAELSERGNQAADELFEDIFPKQDPPAGNGGRS